MKKALALFALVFLAQSFWAQEGQEAQEQIEESVEVPAQEEAAVQDQDAWVIQDVLYEPQGGTKVSALKRTLNIAPGKSFSSRKELDEFVVATKQKLINERLFESVEISAEQAEGASAEESAGSEEGASAKEAAAGAKAVLLRVQTVDSGHFLFMPYPKYDSNEGFIFKVKLKDDNFSGLMKPLSSDVFVQYETKEGKSDDFVAGASLEYQLPFSLGPVQASWNNDLFFKHAFIRSEPEWNLNTGLTFVLPFDRVSLRLDLTQGFVRDADYKVFNDELYWVENAKFSIPIILERFKKIGNLVYKPAVEIDAKWNLDGINSQDEDLFSPRLIFSHELTLGQVNWIGNYRRGFQASAAQSMAYNFYLNEFQPGVKITGTAFAAWKYAGINSRLMIFAERNKYTRFGKYLRGVSDDQYFAGVARTPNGYSTKGTSAIILNFDIPIHLMTVRWKEWGVPFLSFFDCEMQVMPFFDVALSANRITKRVFDPRDGFYCAGVEFNVFPEKWKSVQIRTSFGLDIGRLLFSDKLDTSWRDEKSSKYELTVGIGLFF